MEKRNRTRGRRVLFGLKEELCRLLVEESADGVCVLTGGRVEYCNAAFLNLMGLKAEEIEAAGEGIIWRDLPPVGRERVEDWRRYQSEARNPLPSGALRFVSKAGRSLALNLNAVRGKKERTIILARDITELYNCHLRLQEQEKILAGMIDEASTPVFVVQDGRIRFANKVVFEVFGYHPEELIGTGIDLYLMEEEKGRILQLYEERLTQKPIKKRWEMGLKHKNGHRVDVEIEVNLVSYDGVPAEIVIMHDITARKEMEIFQARALAKIRAAFGATIRVLNNLVEAKDPYTGGHQKRVADLSRTIATEMKLSAEQVDGLRLAAEIHDIGKIIVPSEILSKPGVISESEWGLVKNHVKVGYELLKDIEFPWPVAEIIYQHHERLNGSGYPRGLKGEQIIIEARILAVADVVEAMSSHRPYREAHSLEETMAEIEKNKGILYDEKVAEVCLALFRKKGYNFSFNRR
ncbi:MAG: PAS domain S-box protein [Candidatus Saccharicenans sp.]|nr:PAS domain S-box protein [Candidatus Saccharicenans sp.]